MLFDYNLRKGSFGNNRTNNAGSTDNSNKAGGGSKSKESNDELSSIFKEILEENNKDKISTSFFANKLKERYDIKDNAMLTKILNTIADNHDDGDGYLSLDDFEMQEKYDEISSQLYSATADRLGTDEEKVHEILNNESLTGDDWANIIQTYESIYNRNLIDDVDADFSGITESKERNEIMKKITSKLLESIESGSDFALEIACSELYASLKLTTNMGGREVFDDNKADEFAINLLSGNDKTNAMILSKYSQITGSNLIEDIQKNDSISKANKDLILHRLDVANTYILSEFGNNQSAFEELNLDNYPDSAKNKAWTINLLIQGLNSSLVDFQNQNNEDGSITANYNLIKALTGLGLSSQDLVSAFEEQETLIYELTKALNGESELSFEETFKKLTGVDYDEEKIIKYQELSNQYSIAYRSIQSTQMFQESVSNAGNMQEVLDLFISYFGDETRGKEELLAYLQDGMIPDQDDFEDIRRKKYGFNGYVTDISFDDNGQLVITRNNKIDGGEDEFETVSCNLAETANIINELSMLFDDNRFVNQVIGNIEDCFGYTIENLQEEYYNAKKEALGGADKLEETINEYCQSQSNFIDKLAGVTQVAGMVTIVTGVITTFVNPPAGSATGNIGKSIMAYGRYMALSGMFGDNILKAVDGLSSANGLTKDEARALIKETLKEVGYLALGGKINSVAEAVQAGAFKSLTSLGVSKGTATVLSWLAEGGTDMALSVLSDFVITGDANLSGNTIQVLMGILTGVANAKVRHLQEQRIGELEQKFETGEYTNVREEDVNVKERSINNKLQDANIEVNDKNIQAASDLIKLGVDINKASIDAVLKLQAEGFEVNKVNLDIATDLINNKFSVTEDNLKIGLDILNSGRGKNYKLGSDDINRVKKYSNGNDDLRNMLAGCRTDLEAEYVVKTYEQLSEKLGPDELKCLIARFHGEVGTAPNGWTSSSVFYSKLAHILASDDGGLIKTEMNKYLSNGGEYNEIFQNTKNTIQPADFIKLINNPSYGNNLKNLINGATIIVDDGVYKVVVELEYDKNVFNKSVETEKLEFILTKDMLEIMGKEGLTNSFVKLATQPQYCNNLKLISSDSKAYAKVIGALKNMEPYIVNKILSLGDFEFKNFVEMASALDMSKFESWQQRTIIDTVSVTSRYETVMAIAKNPELFGIDGEVPIEYACIIANSCKGIDDIKQGICNIEAITGKKFTMESSSDAAALRLFTDIANIENMSDIEKRIMAYSALMDNDYYLQSSSKPANISDEILNAFCKKLIDSGIELPKDASVVDMINLLQKQIYDYAAEPFAKGNEAEGILSNLNIKSPEEIKNFQAILESGNADEISRTINSIINSADGLDYYSIRQTLIMDMRKAGLSEDIIRTTIADADIAEDLKHIQKINSNTMLEDDIKENEFQRLIQDISIILATEYPQALQSSKNIESKITEILDSIGIKDGPAYDYAYDNIGLITGYVSGIVESQKQLPQTEIEPGYKIIDATDVDGNGTNFEGYVYAVGALVGNDTTNNSSDTLIKFYKVFHRADGNYRNEVLSSSYIDIGSGMSNTYQNIGVILYGGPNSLIAAMPFDASTHMGAAREQLAGYYFESSTMDISEQGFVYNYRKNTVIVLEEFPNGNPDGAVPDAAILSGNQDTIFNSSKPNEALLLDPRVSAIFFKGNKDDIPEDLKEIAIKLDIPIVVIP